MLVWAVAVVASVASSQIGKVEKGKERERAHVIYNKDALSK